MLVCYKLRDKFGKSLEAKTLEEIPSHFLRFIQFHGIQAPENDSDLEMKENNNNNNFDRRFQLSKQFSSQSVLYPDLNDEGLMEDYNNRNLHFDEAPLPPGWERAYMPDGRCYYVNHKQKVTQWMVCLYAMQCCLLLSVFDTGIICLYIYIHLASK